MALTAAVTRSGDQNLDALLMGIRWDAGSLTYSFPASSLAYEAIYGGGEPGSGFMPLNQVQTAAANKAFAMIAFVTNLDFLEVQEDAAHHAELRLAGASIPAAAWAYSPGEAGYSGDAWFRTASASFADMRPGGYGFYVVMHEIGHSLGLKHGHDTGVFGAMTPDQDSMEYSAMTYRSYVGAAGRYMENEPWGYAQSLMMYDIAALQHMYGADYTANAGNTVYRWSPTTGQAYVDGIGQGAPIDNRILMTVWDGGGNDTYDFSNYTCNLSIDLRPGSWTRLEPKQVAELGYLHPARGNVANSLLHDGDLRSVIENAIGGVGNDVMVGNTVRNILKGGGGADRLFGGEGNDVLSGGMGKDVLTGGTGQDVFVFNTKPGPTSNLDRITDFSVRDDTIHLENGVFTKLGKAGRLPASAFWSGVKAHDASDRIIYDKAHGGLYYDPDGIGSAAKIMISSLPKGLKITWNDFVVF
jgi:Ca2+-binding RTX toxin-like protein